MSQSQRLSLLALRLVLGWMYFYAGITKVLNPDWSAAGYLKGAKMFTGLYQWMLGPSILPVVNFLNEWGLLLLGVSLLLGVFVRASTVLGVLLMVLYYIPLGFPYPNSHAFIVDEHVIYSAGLILLFAFNAGTVWGLDTWVSGKLAALYPKSK